MAIREELTLGLQGWKRGIDEARSDVRRLNRDIKQETRGGFAAQAGWSDKGTTGAIASTARSLGPAVIAMAAFRTGVEAVSVSMERQRAEMDLGAVSTEDAGDQLERLAELAESPGLGFDQAVAFSTRLQAVKVSADLAERSMKEFGNALALVGGTPEQLDGVSLAISQIFSKGKVSAEEIDQIAERLPQIRSLMQDAFGTADTEVLQKMGIGAEEFLAAITESAAQLPRAAETASSALSNLKDDWKAFMQSVGDTIEPAMAPLFRSLSELLEQSATVVEKVASVHTVASATLFGTGGGREAADSLNGGSFAEATAELEKKNRALVEGGGAQKKPSEIAAEKKAADDLQQQMEDFDRAEAEGNRDAARRREAAAAKRASDLEKAAEDRARLAENVAGMAFAVMDPEAQLAALRTRVQNSLGVSSSREEILKASADAANEGWLEKAQIGYQTVAEMDAIAGRMQGPAASGGGSAQGSFATLMDQIFGRGTAEEQLKEIRDMRVASQDQKMTLDKILKKMDEEPPRDVWTDSV